MHDWDSFADHWSVKLNDKFGALMEGPEPPAEGSECVDIQNLNMMEYIQSMAPTKDESRQCWSQGNAGAQQNKEHPCQKETPMQQHAE